MIDLLYNLGDDALTNLFDVILPPFPGAIDPIQTQFRVFSLNIPSTGADTYDVHYKTMHIPKISGKVVDPKRFSFSFRVDHYWKVYNGLKNWKNLILNTRTGFKTLDIAGVFRVPITILSSGSGGELTGGKWVFEGAACLNVADVPFNYESGDPLTLDAEFTYLVLNDNF